MHYIAECIVAFFLHMSHDEYKTKYGSNKPMLCILFEMFIGFLMIVAFAFVLGLMVNR